MGTKKSFQFERAVGNGADAVWSTLAAIGGVDEWLPIITSCRVDGEGGGAHRTCETADGGVLRERILEVDHRQRRLAYEVHEGLPVSKYTGVFQIVEEDGESTLRWTVEAEGDPEAIGQIDAMLQQVVPLAFDGLEATARRAAGVGDGSASPRSNV